MTISDQETQISASRQYGSTRLLELDALRGVAALIVVLHHVFIIFNEEVRIATASWIFVIIDAVQAQNKRAVLLFFVLSGYAIGLGSWVRLPVTRVTLLRYAVKRTLRIVPLYYISLIWTAGLGLIYGFERASFSFTNLLGNVVFLQTSASAEGSWFVPYGDNGPYWSLSYEVFFYIALPAALLLANAHRIAHRSHVRLIWMGIGATFLGIAGNTLAPSPFSLFLTSWVVWLVGFVAANMKPRIGSVLLLALPPLVMVTAMCALAETGRSSDTLNLVFEGTVIAFVFSVVTVFPWWNAVNIVKALRSSLVWLFAPVGQGSYALYLLHYPLLLAVHELLDAPLDLITWWVAVMGLVLFSLWFCPWLERLVGVLFRRPSWL